MSRNYVKHGICKLQRRQKQRRNGPIDRRTRAGKNALRVQAGLIADQGGADNITTATLVLIEVIARDVAYLDEIDSRIFEVLKKYPMARKNPKSLHTFYSFRQPVLNSLNRNIALLGHGKRAARVPNLAQLLQTSGTPVGDGESVNMGNGISCEEGTSLERGKEGTRVDARKCRT